MLRLSQQSKPTPFGAYGLCIEAIGLAAHLPGLQPIPPSLGWPCVRLSTRGARDPRPPRHELSDDHATILLIEEEYITVRRHPPHATYHLHRNIDAHELVHPYLAGAAGVFNAWYGRMTFHSGGIAVDGRVWGVLGHKEAGKTTTLAQLHLGGVQVITDDLLVLDGMVVLTGPRCVDLRAPTMERLAGPLRHEDIVPVREGERYRLALPPAPVQLPFAGWVLLQDDATISVRRVPPSERFGVLTNEHLIAGARSDVLLDLLSLPMWVLNRPRSWSALPRALDALLRTLHV